MALRVGFEQERQLLPKKVEAIAGQRVIAVSAGRYHSLALTADGAVWSWGYGTGGKLGHGDEQDQLLPKQVEAFAGQRVVAVSAGGPPQPRPHCRRRRLYLGRGRPRLPRPRRGPVEPAAAQEDRGARRRVNSSIRLDVDDAPP